MNIKKIFTLFSLIIAFALIAAAQNKNKDRDSAERQRLEESRRQQEELIENVEEKPTSDINGLEFFLPKTKNSWYIVITENGGFRGVPRILGAVNSEGNYLCSPQQNFKAQFINKDLFDSLVQTVGNFDFKGSEFKRPGELKYCNDCLYKSLTFQSKNKVYRYSRKDFAVADDEIKEIYNKIITSAACS